MNGAAVIAEILKREGTEFPLAIRAIRLSKQARHWTFDRYCVGKSVSASASPTVIRA